MNDDDIKAGAPANNRQTPSQANGLTVRQKILVAAVALTESAPSFTTADLVVRCWTMFPEAFALRGHPEHADSNKVLAKLSGADGLAGLGWIELTSQNTYRVTRRGRRVAEQLRAVEKPLPELVALAPVSIDPTKRRAGPRTAKRPATPPTEFTDADHDALVRLVRTDSLRKFLRGSPLTFADACSFWGIARVSGTTVSTRVDATEALLKRAVESFGEKSSTDPRLPPLSTCYGLLNLHRLMLGRFERELARASTAKSGAP